jgi:hypothetical protein
MNRSIVGVPTSPLRGSIICTDFCFLCAAHLYALKCLASFRTRLPGPHAHFLCEVAARKWAHPIAVRPLFAPLLLDPLPPHANRGGGERAPFLCTRSPCTVIGCRGQQGALSPMWQPVLAPPSRINGVELEEGQKRGEGGIPSPFVCSACVRSDRLPSF